MLDELTQTTVLAEPAVGVALTARADHTADNAADRRGQAGVGCTQ